MLFTSFKNYNLINLSILLSCIAILLFWPTFPFYNYDQTISILCSNGISHDVKFDSNNEITSLAISKLNNTQRVIEATKLDNSNSLLYNLLLHYFILLFGNSPSTYILLSKLVGVICLVSIYRFTKLLLGNSIFVSVSILLLVTDIRFWGHAHEIRAYILTMLCLSEMSIYTYKYLFIKPAPKFLWFSGLFAVFALLSHYLSVSIICVAVLWIIVYQWENIKKPTHFIALLIPVFIFGLYILYMLNGLQTMTNQNQQISLRKITDNFTVKGALLGILKITTINFRSQIAAFSGKPISIFISSYLTIIILYITYIKQNTSIDRKKVIFFTTLSISCSVLQLILAIKSKHYTAIHYRYLSFATPFVTLLLTLVIYTAWTNIKKERAISIAILLYFSIPNIYIYIKGGLFTKIRYDLQYISLAKEIQATSADSISCKTRYDACLVNCFLPKKLNVKYHAEKSIKKFSLYKKGVPLNSTIVEKLKR